MNTRLRNHTSNREQCRQQQNESFEYAISLVPQLAVDGILEALVPPNYSLDRVITFAPDVLSNMSQILTDTRRDVVEAFFVCKAFEVCSSSSHSIFFFNTSLCLSFSASTNDPPIQKLVRDMRSMSFFTGKVCQQTHAPK
jgi:hypothetical protein